MSRDGAYKGHNDKIVTVPMNPELHKRLHIQAIKEGSTIKAVVTTAIQNYLMEHEKETF